MKYILIVSVVGLLISGCNRPSSESETTPPLKDTTRTYIHKQFQQMDSVYALRNNMEQWYEAMDSLNENIYNALLSLANGNRYQDVDLTSDKKTFIPAINRQEALFSIVEYHAGWNNDRLRHRSHLSNRKRHPDQAP